MDADSSRWNEIRASGVEGERRALEWVRSQLPDHEPWRAWSNFEFISEDGTISEVDLLILSPRGIYLVEIKSWKGTVHGDAGTWVQTTPNHRRRSYDNPRILTDRKAKRFKSLIQRQSAMRKPGVNSSFFVEAVVFLSDPSFSFQLDKAARHNVFLRDDHPSAEKNRALAFAAFLNRQISPYQIKRIDRVFAKAFGRSMESAGIRPSVKRRRALDYEMSEVIMEGPGYQDFLGTHTNLNGDFRRVRVYTAPLERDEERRALVRRAAQREYEALKGLHHPGILGAHNYTETELGPALLFDHDPDAQRLDLFMRERAAELGLDARLQLIRSIAEALKSAHEHRVYHRALSPLSILVKDEGGPLRPQIFNWQTAARQIETSTRGGATLTQHLNSFIDDQAQVYLAPEARHKPDSPGRDFDVFGMGALSYFILSGHPPAESRAELCTILEQNSGLQLAAHMELRSPSLEGMISDATHPNVGSRLAGVDEILELLDRVEGELTDPDAERLVDDPLKARPGDRLEGELDVLRRLGSGATSVALEVQHRDHGAVVLKIANDPRHNATLDDEAATLDKLRHRGIVELHGRVSIGGLNGLLLSKAGTQTLAARLRQGGPLDLSLLQHLGEDLLSVLSYLEAEGRWHRDLKPDNLGVVESEKRRERPRLVVFDFSLSRIPAERVEAGTHAYLDPFVQKRGRYDVEAERYSAALVLHEMAVGSLPIYGDGQSDPAVIDDEVVIDEERLPLDHREGLAEFFRRTLSRDVAKRIPSAREMEVAWVRIFQERSEVAATPRKPAPGASKPGKESVEDSLSAATRLAVANASLDTKTALLGLSTRARNALRLADVLEIRDLLDKAQSSYLQQAGVGPKTRRELQALAKLARERFVPQQGKERRSSPELPELVLSFAPPPGVRSLDAILPTLLPPSAKKGTGKVASTVLTALLGLDPELTPQWPEGAGPTQAQVARHVGKTSARVSQILVQQRKLWHQDPELEPLRDAVVGELARQGGVMTGTELKQHLLDLRGSSSSEPQRSREAAAILRCVLEAESEAELPRFEYRRSGRVLLVAAHHEGGVDADALFAYAAALGRKADGVVRREALLSPQRAREELETVPLPEGGAPLAHERLLRLASAASEEACVASTAELYPRRLAAERALKLASASLVAHAGLKLDRETLDKKLRARYPEMGRLPGVSELERCIADAGLDFVWDKDQEAFVSRSTQGARIITASSAGRRLSTQFGQARLDSPEVAQAAATEEKLIAARKVGGFLVLGTDTRLLLRAEDEVARRFELRWRSFEAELLAAMETAGKANRIAWETVIETDAGPRDSDDFHHLRQLASLAFDACSERWLAEAAEGEILLLSRTGLLARLGLIPKLEALADRLRRGLSRPFGLWVLIAARDQHAQPVLENQPIPIIGSSEWLRLEEAWVRNFHRAGAAAAAALSPASEEKSSS